MAETYATKLARVETAIATIENGSQSYTIGDRTFTRADIKELYAREKRLIMLAERETRGGIRVRHATPATGR